MARNSFESSDAQMAWDDLRTSPAFPAVVGGLAGAVGGIALMLVMGRLRGPKETLPAAYDAEGNPMNVVYLPPPRSPRLLGFTPGDILTLATIGLSLVRQVQDMAHINDLKEETEVVQDQKEILEARTGVPAPPASTVPAAQKKK